MNRINSLSKLMSKALVAVIGLAVIAGCSAKTPEPAPAPTAPAPQPAPAEPTPAPPAAAKPATPAAAPQTPRPRQVDASQPVPADRKNQVLADAKKVTALANQIETSYVKAKEAYTTYYGKDNQKGNSLVEPLDNDATLAMEQLVGPVAGDVAPDVFEYLDNVVVEAAAKLHAIESWKDALGGTDGAKASEEAGKFAQRASAAASNTAKVREALATRLGVSADALSR